METIETLISFAQEALTKCSICQDDIKTAVLLECSHSFCQECLKAYLQQQEKRTSAFAACPLCKRLFSRRSIKNICPLLDNELYKNFILHLEVETGIDLTHIKPPKALPMIQFEKDRYKIIDENSKIIPGKSSLSVGNNNSVKLNKSDGRSKRVKSARKALRLSKKVELPTHTPEKKSSAEQSIEKLGKDLRVVLDVIQPNIQSESIEKFSAAVNPNATNKTEKTKIATHSDSRTPRKNLETISKLKKTPRSVAQRVKIISSEKNTISNLNGSVKNPITELPLIDSKLNAGKNLTPIGSKSKRVNSIRSLKRVNSNENDKKTFATETFLLNNKSTISKSNNFKNASSDNKVNSLNCEKDSVISESNLTSVKITEETLKFIERKKRNSCEKSDKTVTRSETLNNSRKMSNDVLKNKNVIQNLNSRQSGLVNKESPGKKFDKNSTPTKLNEENLAVNDKTNTNSETARKSQNPKDVSKSVLENESIIPNSENFDDESVLIKKAARLNKLRDSKNKLKRSLTESKSEQINKFKKLIAEKLNDNIQNSKNESKAKNTSTKNISISVFENKSVFPKPDSLIAAVNSTPRSLEKKLKKDSTLLTDKKVNAPKPLLSEKENNESNIKVSKNLEQVSPSIKFLDKSTNTDLLINHLSKIDHLCKNCSSVILSCKDCKCILKVDLIEPTQKICQTKVIELTQKVNSSNVVDQSNNHLNDDDDIFNDSLEHFLIDMPSNKYPTQKLKEKNFNNQTEDKLIQNKSDEENRFEITQIPKLNTDCVKEQQPKSINKDQLESTQLSESNNQCTNISNFMRELCENAGDIESFDILPTPMKKNTSTVIEESSSDNNDVIETTPSSKPSKKTRKRCRISSDSSDSELEQQPSIIPETEQTPRKSRSGRKKRIKELPRMEEDEIIPPPPEFVGTQDVTLNMNNYSSLPETTIVKNAKTPATNIDIQNLKEGIILITEPVAADTTSLESTIEATPLSCTPIKSRINLLSNRKVRKLSEKIDEKSVDKESEELFLTCNDDCSAQKKTPLEIITNDEPIIIHSGPSASKQISMRTYLNRSKNKLNKSQMNQNQDKFNSSQMNQNQDKFNRSQINQSQDKFNSTKMNQSQDKFNNSQMNQSQYEFNCLQMNQSGDKFNISQINRGQNIFNSSQMNQSEDEFNSLPINRSGDKFNISQMNRNQNKFNSSQMNQNQDKFNSSQMNQIQDKLNSSQMNRAKDKLNKSQINQSQDKFNSSQMNRSISKLPVTMSPQLTQQSSASSQSPLNKNTLGRVQVSQSSSQLIHTPNTERFCRPPAFSTPLYPPTKVSALSSRIELMGTRLQSEQTSLLKKFCDKFNIKFSSQDNNTATHLVTETNPNDNCIAELTVKAISAVARGIWIVSFKWVEDCLDRGRLLPEEPYEILDVNGGCGPKRARLSTRPSKLFRKFNFCILSITTCPLDKLKFFIEHNGGTIFSDVMTLAKQTNKIPLIISEPDDESENTSQVEEIFEQYGILSVTDSWIFDSIICFQINSVYNHLIGNLSKSPPKIYPQELLINSQFTTVDLTQ